MIICISLIPTEIKYLLVYVLATHISPTVKCLFISICLCILTHRLSLYMVTCLLLCILKIFSQFVSYHLTSLMISFVMLKFLIFMKSTISVFSCGSTPINN